MTTKPSATSPQPSEASSSAQQPTSKATPYVCVLGLCLPLAGVVRPATALQEARISVAICGVALGITVAVALTLLGFWPSALQTFKSLMNLNAGACT